jgi:elongation factor Ts
VAKTVEFQAFVKDVVMQITASNPLYVRREDVPQEVLEREKTIYRNQAREAGKPEKILDKIAEGKLEKFYQEVCLMEQPFIKNTDSTIKELLEELVTKLGENILIRRFVRFQLGETAES